MFSPCFFDGEFGGMGFGLSFDVDRASSSGGRGKRTEGARALAEFGDPTGPQMSAVLLQPVLLLVSAGVLHEARGQCIHKEHEDPVVVDEGEVGAVEVGHGIGRHVHQSQNDRERAAQHKTKYAKCRNQKEAADGLQGDGGAAEKLGFLWFLYRNGMIQLVGCFDGGLGRRGERREGRMRRRRVGQMRRAANRNIRHSRR